ncbi:MAG TPA: hypothetical protein PLG17_08575 [Thermodesulfobacteriota bacterium]|nr:hypothetical protein [Deltaproteobacteria bacterium]HNR12657.1 hypothetical protein [Thermodesulfobacteriota bacterium]HNU70318.1 hypothetical protein [Thermodesulfobacteriota bacterium]HQO78552.1 hypothetical protein [Thermodesulfobacteriota bacterium]
MRSFSRWDFTLSTYAHLCDALLESGYTVLTVAALIERGQNENAQPLAVLRHDVDRRPFCAERMANLEQERGISSTYYFRARSHTFRHDIIRAIAAMGHEIGYHYENLSDARGNMDAAIENFRHNLLKFRQLARISTICMHGSPLSAWDNRNLWKQYAWADFDIIGEPYFSLDYSSLLYVTDTGRQWNSQSATNIRDRVPATMIISPRSTHDLADLVRSKRYPRLLIQCHPERWAHTVSEWMWSFMFDRACNIVKRMIVRSWLR